MDRYTYAIDNGPVYLYPAEKADAPLIVQNEFEGDGSRILAELKKLGDYDLNFLFVSGIDWNREMSPWEAPAAYGKDDPFTGGADVYLTTLLDEIIPEAREHIPGNPAFTAIAGYSLAGLFALYAMYRTDRFARVASMSGSMWFPKFAEFAKSHDMLRKPEKMYFSLGDREAKTRNALMKTVQERTEELVAFYRGKGIDVTWELNPGNHFRDPERRVAKGIAAILEH